MRLAPNRKVSGWMAVTPSGTRIPLCAGDSAGARLACIAMLGPEIEHVQLFEAVALDVKNRLVWSHVETLRARDAEDGDADVDIDGALLAKVNPNKLTANAQKQLTRELSLIDQAWAKDALEKFVGDLDINWGTASKEQIDAAFARARAHLDALAVGAVFINEVVKPWTHKVEVSTLKVSNGTRAWVKQTYLPKISGSLSLKETEAVKRVADQQGWFLRGEQGQRSDALTARGKLIVQQGLEDGLGRHEIGKMLEELPGLWNGRSRHYASVCASVSTDRARSWGHVTSYRSAHVQKLEFVAVLDEKTTDICRYADGSILDVDGCAALAQRGADVETPEDIASVNPFVRNVREGDRTFLDTSNGVRIAEILRSGVGNRDDRGSFNAHIVGSQLTSKAQIGLPPLHFACRSTVVPVLSMWAVPKGYEAVTVPGRPTEPFLRVVDGGWRGPGSLATHRALRLVRTDHGGTVRIGDDLPLEMGETQGFAADVVRKTRVGVRVINDHVCALIERRGGGMLSRHQLGFALRTAIVDGSPGPYRHGDSLTSEALTPLGRKLRDALAKVALPEIEHEGLTHRDKVAHVRRTLGPWIDSVGRNASAGSLWRMRYATPKALKRGERFALLDGRWSDPRVGSMWMGEPLRNEVFSIAFACLTEGFESALALSWQTNPNHLGFLWAYLRGAFL